MADATFLMPPSPGLSATLLSNKSVEHYSLKGPENVKIPTLHRCTGKTSRTATWHNDSCCDYKFWLKVSNLIFVNRTGLVCFLINFFRKLLREMNDITNFCSVRMHVTFSEITATRHGHCFLTACCIFKPQLQNVIDHGSSKHSLKIRPYWCHIYQEQWFVC